MVPLTGTVLLLWTLQACHDSDLGSNAMTVSTRLAVHNPLLRAERSLPIWPFTHYTRRLAYIILVRRP